MFLKSLSHTRFIKLFYPRKYAASTPLLHAMTHTGTCYEANCDAWWLYKALTMQVIAAKVRTVTAMFNNFNRKTIGNRKSHMLCLS